MGHAAAEGAPGEVGAAQLGISQSAFDALAEEQQEAIRAESAREPLVSEKLPLEALRTEYLGSDVFVEKIDKLRSEHGKTAYRRVRKDGSCFYRALLYALTEKLLAAPEDAQELLRRVPAGRAQLEAAGFSKLVYEDFEEEWRGLLQGIAEGRFAAAALHDLMLGVEWSNSLVMYMRLGASAALRTRAFFADYFESGAELAKFCAGEVERLDAEADHLQISALHAFFDEPVRIFCLDSAPGGLSLFVVPEAAPRCRVELLFRPGHYDILY